MRRSAGSAAAEAEESQRADLPIKGGNGKKGWSRSTNSQALESNFASRIDGSYLVMGANGFCRSLWWHVSFYLVSPFLPLR